MTPANEPVTQREAGRRRQRRGTDTHRPRMSTIPVGGVSPEPRSPPRGPLTREARNAAWLRELASTRSIAAAGPADPEPPARYSPGPRSPGEGEPARGGKPGPVGLGPHPTSSRGCVGRRSCDAGSRRRRGKTRRAREARRGQLGAGWKPREARGPRGAATPEPSRDPRRLRLAAAETRGNPGPPAAALRREERGAELLLGARAPPGARNPRRRLLAARAGDGREFSSRGVWDLPGSESPAPGVSGAHAARTRGGAVPVPPPRHSPRGGRAPGA